MEATTWTEALCCKRVAIGRFSEHAGRNQMNAEQASKKSMRRPTRRCNGEGCQRPGSERRAHRSAPPGYWRQHACKRGDGGNTGSPVGGAHAPNRESARTSLGRPGWRRGA